ncbi:MAG: helix-turn-helix domain-containing protein [Rickettsiales bacterium]|nr:MAG: helix-turn-helix domain-containing protein [Rickettsiales bacterium]
MSKKIFNDIMEGLNEIIRLQNGEDTGAIVHKPTEIKKIREKYNLSQSKFAKEFGFNVQTIRSWEQYKRIPDNSSKILLKIIDKYPNVVREAVGFSNQAN